MSFLEINVWVGDKSVFFNGADPEVTVGIDCFVAQVQGKTKREIRLVLL